MDENGELLSERIDSEKVTVPGDQLDHGCTGDIITTVDHDHSYAASYKTGITLKGILIQDHRQVGNNFQPRKVKWRRPVISCKDCGEVFNTNLMLTKHLIGTKHGIKCEKCDLWFNNKLQMKEHISTRHKTKTKPRPRHAWHTCETCSECFTSEKAFRKHNLDEHKIVKPFKCGTESCGKTFKTKGELRSHSTTHYEHRLFSCTLCDGSYKTQQLLKLHQNVHKPNRNIPCDIAGCTKTFKTKAGLYFHKRNIHFPKPKVTCPYCKKSLLNKMVLKNHVNLVHAGTATSVNCETCNKQFKCKEHLERHRKRMHSKEVGFICSKCGKQFAFQCELRKHFTRHDTLQQWMCHICGKTFPFKFVLNKHHRSHSDERPFSCDICPAAYKDKYKLKQHMKKVHNK